MKLQKIEIDFPVPVNLPPGFEQVLSSVVGLVCRQYEKKNPERVMWAAGHGSKPTYIPLTEEDEKERGMEFDDNIYYIEVAERQKYKNEK